mmetsp:Transcript_30851/g.76741  ORF Transcript_30851/g.76741 Transcript_30851/m.76741 type:complete len:287 (-) Transcript_30851:1118-1978(-)
MASAKRSCSTRRRCLSRNMPSSASARSSRFSNSRATSSADSRCHSSAPSASPSSLSRFMSTWRQCPILASNPLTRARSSAISSSAASLRRRSMSMMRSYSRRSSFTFSCLLAPFIIPCHWLLGSLFMNTSSCSSSSLFVCESSSTPFSAWCSCSIWVVSSLRASSASTLAPSRSTSATRATCRSRSSSRAAAMASCLACSTLPSSTWCSFRSARYRSWLVLSSGNAVLSSFSSTRILLSARSDLLNSSCSCRHSSTAFTERSSDSAMRCVSSSTTCVCFLAIACLA